MNKKKVTIERFGGINEYSSSLGDAIEMVNLSITEDGKLKKRRSKKKLIELQSERILAAWEGMIRGVECVLYITCGGFYKYLSGAEAAIFLRPTTASRAFLFEFDEKVYIFTDVDIFCFDGGTIERVEGYIPTVAISTDADGGCELFEAANMLTPRRKQLFSTDGTSVILRLLENDIKSIVSVKHLGEVISSLDYTFDASSSTITLDVVIPKGENVIEVEYEANSSGRAEILKYERGSIFGGGNDTRVFLYASPDKPSYRRHSEIGGGISRADYFPENNFVSLSGKVITSIIRHYDRQIIFCLDSTFYSVDELRSDSLGNYYHSFPVYALNSEKGHIGGNDTLLIKNEPISVTYDGIYRWVSTSVRDERNAIKISGRVDGTVLRFLMRRNEYPIRLYDDDISEELWVVSGDEALIYNYGIDVWYFYRGIKFTTFSRCFDTLLLGSDDGEICAFEESDEEVAILYVSGATELGRCDAIKDISAFSLGVKSGGGDIELKLSGRHGDLRHKLVLKAKDLIDIIKRRFIFKRVDRFSFSICGDIGELTISFITFIFKEGGKLF